MDSGRPPLDAADLSAQAAAVRWLARRLVRDADRADDLAQDALVVALERPPRAGWRLGAWLSGVTRNLARRQARADGRRKKYEAAAARQEAASPEETRRRVEEQRRVLDLLLALEEPYRTTVLLRFFDDLPPRAIARRMEVPVETVKTRLKRGIERLRTAMDAAHEGERGRWLVALAPAATGSALGRLGPAKAGFLGLAAVAATAWVVWPAPEKGTPDVAPVTTGREPAPPPAEAVVVPEEARPPEPPVPPRAESPASWPMAAPQRGDEVPPSGTVRVPAGRALVGTTAERVLQVAHGRAPAVKDLLRAEMPRHEVDLPEYFLDACEVTNAQYLVFLEDLRRTWTIPASGTVDLAAALAALLGTDAEAARKDDVLRRQLYGRNRAPLQEAMPSLVVRRADGSIDEAATEAAFRGATLKPGTRLEFWSRRPPRTWTGSGPAEADRNLPVRWTSYDDVEAFAEWAGKHVPTEAEWEHAARGDRESEYPWGNEWFDDASRANWGGKVVDGALVPRLVAVDDPEFAKGRSWCGAWHMLGNVSEWTSSWFEPYPGSTFTHANAGRYVKVIRGASLLDQDPLVLRCAYRNFIGRGPEAPPVPQNRFEYVGFRCAAYPVVGLDRVGPVLRRAARGGVVQEADFEPKHVVGATSTRFAPAEPPPKDGVHVLGRSHTVVLVPRSRLDLPSSLDRVVAASTDGPLVLGVVHSDLPIERVLRPTGAGRPKRGQPPAVEAGTAAAGTWLLALVDGRLALLSADGGLAFLLSTARADREGTLTLAPAGAEGGTARRDASGDSVALEAIVPLRQGALRLRAVLSFEQGRLAQTGPWRTTP